LSLFGNFDEILAACAAADFVLRLLQWIDYRLHGVSPGLAVEVTGLSAITGGIARLARNGAHLREELIAREQIQALVESLEGPARAT